MTTDSTPDRLDDLRTEYANTGMVTSDGAVWLFSQVVVLREMAARAAGPAPATDQAAVRDRIVAAVRRQAETGNVRYEAIADAVLAVLPDRIAEVLKIRVPEHEPNPELTTDPYADGWNECLCDVREALAAVLPAPVDPAVVRATALREAADAVAADTGFHIRYGAAVDYAEHYAGLLRRMADETPQPEAEVVHGCPPDGSGLTPCCGRTPFELPLGDRISSEAPVTCPAAPAAVAQPDEEADGDRIVAYRSPLPGALSVYCTRHTGELGDGVTPLTSDDLPDGGMCAGCGVDVLIPQNTKEADRG